MTRWRDLWFVLAVAVSAAVIGMLAASYAGADEYVCTKKNGDKIRVTDCRLIGPTATPTAQPSPTPTRSPSPLPCEPIGGVKTYQVGEEKMLCFDAGEKRPFMEVQSVNLANTSCSALQIHLSAPSGNVEVGGKDDDIGSQPNAIKPWEPGRWYLWTKLIGGWCFRYTFNAR